MEKLTGGEENWDGLQENGICGAEGDVGGEMEKLTGGGDNCDGLQENEICCAEGDIGVRWRS